MKSKYSSTYKVILLFLFIAVPVIAFKMHAQPKDERFQGGTDAEGRVEKAQGQKFMGGTDAEG